MNRTISLLIALALLVGLAPTAASAAPAQPAPAPAKSARTIASEWRETVTERRGVTVRRALDTPAESHEHGVMGTGARPSATYTSRIHRASNPFTALGASWLASAPNRSIVEVSVRTSADGRRWGPWRLVEADHPDPRDRGRSFGPLVIGDPSTHAQYRVRTFPSARGHWPRVSDVTLTFIDASAGPTAAEAQASRATISTQAVGGASRPTIISRAGWGADEGMRFDSQGREIFPRTYLQVTKAVIHDTVTRNNDPDPARTVRSIYYYHAITRGWGDIGYNYLVDEAGRIYEGRVGGANVVGRHTRCYSLGSVGIAALGWHGDYTTMGIPGVRPSDALVRSIERLTAWVFARQGVDPEGRGVFMERYTRPRGDAPNIMAHRDASAMPTPDQRCENTHVDPGAYLYGRFGEIRRNVRALMGYTPVPQPVIADVKFSPLEVPTGSRLRVDITVRNDGTGLMETQAPNPGTAYAETDTWSSRGYGRVAGKYRVLVDRTNDPTGAWHPYRWGLGSPLLPGEARTITGYIRPQSAGASIWWAGLREEHVATIIARAGDTRVMVTPR